VFLGLDLKTWLKLTVVGAAISTFGALVGIVLKEYVFSRSFEKWKQRRTLEQLYQKFRDPLLLSARELASRSMEILDQYPTVYLRTNVLSLRPSRQIENSTDDPYFQHYKLVSTAYRFCAFLGWLELYRQEITFLHSGSNKHSRELEQAIGLIRADFADGQLNKAKNWLEWRDTLIFREELRAIGESMIESRGASRSIIGYGRFCELLEANDSSPTKKWSTVLLNFVLDLETQRDDFRQIRLKRLLVHLVGLLELLEVASIEKHLVEARNRWSVVV
jgi:hypothetical protein